MRTCRSTFSLNSSLWRILVYAIVGVIVSVASSADGAQPGRSTSPLPQTGDEPADAQHASTTNPPGRIRALLIGVTRYPALPPRHHLKGPANDVQLVKTTLNDRFDVPDDRIEILAEGSDAARLPIRANIRLAFERLAKTASSGDHIVIFMAGHGSQMPNDDGDDPESDGLDEIFLPRDIGFWNGKTGRVENCISDDEIEAWTSAIRATGAFVFFVGDFCHSGTGTRDSGLIARAVARSHLRIPDNTVSPSATEKPEPGPANHISNTVTTGTESVDRNDLGGMVALYAAQPHELAYEDNIPRGGKPHGWLSWALCRVLNETRIPLTYRDLAGRVSWHYQLQRWNRSTPLMDGRDLDQEVLGQRDWSGEFHLTVTRHENRSGKSVTQLNAGRLHGLTRNSILSVSPLHPERTSGQSTKYVRVVSVDELTAEVAACDRQGDLINPTIPVPARCSVVYREFDDVQLLLELNASAIPAIGSRQQLERTLTASLKKIIGQKNLPIRLSNNPGEADLILTVSVDGNSLTLQRRLHEVAAGGLTGTTRFDGSLAANSQENGFVDWFTGLVRRIHRAETLRRLATPLGAQSSQVRLGIELLIRRRGDREHRAVPVENPLIVFDGDNLAIRVRNRGFSSVDLTVLHIAADSTISSIYPVLSQDDYNRCLPGRTKSIEGLQITDETIGWEDILFIGVKARRQPIPRDFSFLAETNPTATSGAVRASGGQPFWNSPFVRFCRASLFRETGLQRGMSSTDQQDVVIHRLSWNVRR